MPNTLSAYLARRFARMSHPRMSIRKSNYFNKRAQAQHHEGDGDSSDGDDSQSDMFAVRLLRRSDPCPSTTRKWYQPRPRSSLSRRLRLRSASFLHRATSRRIPVAHPRHSWPLVAPRAGHASIHKQSSLFRSVLSTSLRLSGLRRKRTTITDHARPALPTTTSVSMPTFTSKSTPPRAPRGLHGHKKSFSESVVRSLSRSRPQALRPVRMSISAPIMPTQPGPGAASEATGHEPPCHPQKEHLNFLDFCTSSPFASRQMARHSQRKSLFASYAPVTFVSKLETAGPAYLSPSQGTLVDREEQISTNNCQEQALSSTRLVIHSQPILSESVWPSVNHRRVSTLSESESDVTLCAQTICSTYTATLEGPEALLEEDSVLPTAGRPRSQEVPLFMSTLLPIHEAAQPSPCSFTSNRQTSKSILRPTKRTGSMEMHCFQPVLGPTWAERPAEIHEMTGSIGDWSLERGRDWGWEWDDSREYLCATEQILRELYGVL